MPLLPALLLALLIGVTPARAREVEMPILMRELPEQMSWEGPSPATDSTAVTPRQILWLRRGSSLFARTPRSAFIGLTARRFGGDGYFDAQARLNSDPRTIFETGVGLRMGTYIFDWLAMGATIQVLSRTIDVNTAGALDASSFGFGDSRTSLQVTLLRSWAHHLALLTEWKAPTGQDDLFEDSAALPVRVASVPLGNAKHELDLGLGYSARIRGARLGADASAFAAYRMVCGPDAFRLAFDPTSGAPYASTVVAGRSLGRCASTDMLVAALGFKLLDRSGRLPMPDIELDWYHPVENSQRNLWNLAAGFQLSPSDRAAIGFRVTAPIYGKLVPDAYPLNFLLRSPGIGLGMEGSVTLWF